ncbi:MAG: ribonuclease HII [Pseudomonadota bacterium]
MIGPLIGPLIGIDEAGRGPLAGPVCAAAVQLPETFDRSGLTDSKRLSPRRRAGLAQRLKAEGALWALGWAQPAEIDRHNILAATHLAMARALDTLVRDYGSDLRRDWVLIDGNRNPARFPAVRRVGSIVKGDQIVAEISAASILAKTERDAVMEALDDARPGYGFAEHKGYPTATHLAALTRLGPSDAHRQSFAPVARVSKGRVNR